MLEILSILDTHDDYSKFNTIISQHSTDKDISRIIHWIGEYYRVTGAPHVEWDDFQVFFFAKNPMIKDAKKEVFEGIFTQLKEYEETELEEVLLNTFLQQYHAERIGFLAMEVAEGKRSDLMEIQGELDDYLNVSGMAESIGKEANRDDLETILTRMSYGTGLRWRMQALNDSLGEIRRGNFILFGGRPDSGKTTLMCSEATHMATQLKPDEKVLYFTNEEGSDAVKLRVISSLLGVDRATIEKDRLTTWDDYVKILGDKDKILVIDKHDMHIKDIDWWLKHEKAGLIVIDQLRKVRGFENLTGVNRLEKLFNYARELSKQYAPVMTVTQLDGFAENEPYPDMSRLYESKTAVQGEMDAIINIGRVRGSVPENTRYLNVVKNKLPTPEVPNERNGMHEVSILPDIARFI